MFYPCCRRNTTKLQANYTRPQKNMRTSYKSTTSFTFLVIEQTLAGIPLTFCICTLCVHVF